MSKDLTILNYIEAWRYWKVSLTVDGFVLQSLFHEDSFWSAKEAATAKCNPFFINKFSEFLLVISFLIAMLLFSLRREGDFWWSGSLAMLSLVLFATTVCLFYLGNHGDSEICSCHILPRSEKKQEKTPSLKGDCGLYGYKDFNGATNNFPFPKQRGLILGRVALWGNVIEHGLGYRAQYAYPLSLDFGICYKCGSFLRFTEDIFLTNESENGKYNIVCAHCRTNRSTAWQKMLLEKYGLERVKCFFGVE